MELMDCLYSDCERGPKGQICCNCRNFTNLCGDHFLGRNNSEPLCTFCDRKERDFEHKELLNVRKNEVCIGKDDFTIHPLDSETYRITVELSKLFNDNWCSLRVISEKRDRVVEQIHLREKVLKQFLLHIGLENIKKIMKES